MKVTLEPNFIAALLKCPEDFQLKFRMAYQQLKIVNHPLDVKGVRPMMGYSKVYKLFIDKSRISLRWKGEKLVIPCFLYNQFLDSD